MNCQQRYCAEHAGARGLCSACLKSSRVGMLILAAVMSLLGTALLWQLAWRAL
jgi:hypothetical protein